jgi:hypothetical protein
MKETHMQIRMTAVAVCLGALLLMLSGRAEAQYQLTNLVSNQVHQAPTIDPLLANAWGLARSATSPWLISDNDTGWSTIYEANGTQESLKVLVPTAGNGPASPTGLNGPGVPTGIVANPSKTDFQIQGESSSFIFATLDGTISAWVPGVNKNQSIIAVDNSANKASYTGLAITNYASGNHIYAADNTNNHIDMFDGNFNLVMSFGDPSIPSTFSVFGIQDINGMVYVAYAVPNVGAGGAIDVFKEDGTFAFADRPAHFALHRPAVERRVLGLRLDSRRAIGPLGLGVEDDHVGKAAHGQRAAAFQASSAAGCALSRLSTRPSGIFHSLCSQRRLRPSAVSRPVMPLGAFSNSTSFSCMACGA